MKVSYKVPATSANIGPGFDCLGMALPVYNIVTIEETTAPAKNLNINLMNDIENAIETNIDNITRDNSNIVYRAVEELYGMVGRDVGNISISIQTGIPVARGLGSSASVIVGGLLAANDILGNPADEAAMLSIATEIEGHPDNVAPAILGGFILSSREESGLILTEKLSWPEDWDITVCIPDFELSTNIARSVLPEFVPIQDAVYNAKHLAMFIQAINTKNVKLMKKALHDKLHQPYREKLIPGMNEIMEAFKNEDNVIGTVLSGAGPSILVISHKYDIDRIKSTVKDIWEGFSIKSDIRNLKIENRGAEIIEE